MQSCQGVLDLGEVEVAAVLNKHSLGWWSDDNSSRKAQRSKEISILLFDYKWIRHRYLIPRFLLLAVHHAGKKGVRNHLSV